MTRFALYLVTCLSFSLTYSDIIKNNDVVELNVSESNNKQNDMETKEISVKKSTSGRSSKEDGSVNCLEDGTHNDISQEHVLRDDPTEDLYQPYYTDPRFQDGYSNISPFMNHATWELPNQMSYVPYEAIDPYDYGATIPYVYQRLYGAVNPLPPMKSLPPVYPTVQDYDIDLPFYFPSTLRSGRLPRRNDDLVHQLEHDAILNNFIPTMPVPFVGDFERSSLYQVPNKLVTHSGSPTFGFYPSVASNDCVRPILVSCSPKITRGVIGQNISPYAAPAPAEYHHPVSTEDHKQTNQETHVAQHVKKDAAKSFD